MSFVVFIVQFSANHKLYKCLQLKYRYYKCRLLYSVLLQDLPFLTATIVTDRLSGLSGYLRTLNTIESQNKQKRDFNVFIQALMESYKIVSAIFINGQCPGKLYENS